jgi:hypothetical protein
MKLESASLETILLLAGILLACTSCSNELLIPEKQTYANTPEAWYFGDAKEFAYNISYETSLQPKIKPDEYMPLSFAFTLCVVDTTFISARVSRAKYYLPVYNSFYHTFYGYSKLSDTFPRKLGILIDIMQSIPHRHNQDYEKNYEANILATLYYDLSDKTQFNFKAPCDSCSKP